MDVDLSEFEVFIPVRQRVKYPIVTVQKRGDLQLNRAAYESLGCPTFVRLYFNRATRQIGIRSSDDSVETSIPVMAVPGNGVFIIASLSFCKTYGIKTGVTTRFAASMEDGMLICNLDLAQEISMQKQSGQEG